MSFKIIIFSSLLFIIFIIYLLLQKLLTINISDAYTNILNMAAENIYIFGILFSQMYYIILPIITSMIGFICNSTFITWFHISINDADRYGFLSEWTMHYFSKLYNDNKMYGLSSIMDIAMSTKKIWYDKNSTDSLPQIRYIPTTYNLFWFKNRLILVNIHSIHNIHMYTLCVPWRRFYIWKELFDDVRKLYKTDVESKQKIYKIDYNSYDRQGFTQPNLVDKVLITDGKYTLTKEMNQVVEHVKDFLSESTKKYCNDNKLTYCNRIYLHGPPGTGKSQLPIRIAGEFNLPLYQLNCNGISDADLEYIFDKISNGVVVIDEIDNYIQEIIEQKRMMQTQIKNDNNDNNQNNNKSNNQRTLPTLSGWHKVLDNLSGNQIIIFFTTNNNNLIQKLNHGSFVRAERIDLIQEIGWINSIFIKDILCKYYEICVENIKLIIDFDEIALGPADIISCIKLAHGDLNKALQLINIRITGKNNSVKKIKDAKNRIEKF